MAFIAAEEQRAAEWRRSIVRRRAAARSREASLIPAPTERIALGRAWGPLFLALDGFERPEPYVSPRTRTVVNS